MRLLGALAGVRKASDDHRQTSSQDEPDTHTTGERQTGQDALIACVLDGGVNGLQLVLGQRLQRFVVDIVENNGFGLERIALRCLGLNEAEGITLRVPRVADHVSGICAGEAQAGDGHLAVVAGLPRVVASYDERIADGLSW